MAAMPASLKGRDRYSGSECAVTIAREGGYVTLTVGGSESNNEVLLTPAQADAVGAGLSQQASLAVKASELIGEFDL